MSKHLAILGAGPGRYVAAIRAAQLAENFLGHPRTIKYDVIPTGSFTLPEIGRVGLTEQQARDRCLASGKDPQQALKIGRFRYGGFGKAQATGDIQGLVKVIALAMHLGATVLRMADMIHAHQTFSEGLMEAVEDVHGQAIHLARKTS